jgi:hypothetical protein
MPRHPMRDPIVFVASDEDRRIYRRGMRWIALVYGTILVVAVGLTMWRSHHRAEEMAAKARMESGLTIDLAHVDW